MLFTWGSGGNLLDPIKGMVAGTSSSGVIIPEFDTELPIPLTADAADTMGLGIILPIPRLRLGPVATRDFIGAFKAARSRMLVRVQCNSDHCVHGVRNSTLLDAGIQIRVV